MFLKGCGSDRKFHSLIFPFPSLLVGGRFNALWNTPSLSRSSIFIFSAVFHWDFFFFTVNEWCQHWPIIYIEPLNDYRYRSMCLQRIVQQVDCCVYKLKTINTLTCLLPTCKFLTLLCFLPSLTVTCTISLTIVRERVSYKYTVCVRINTNCYLCLFFVSITPPSVVYNDAENKWTMWLNTDLSLCFFASSLFQRSSLFHYNSQN